MNGDRFKAAAFTAACAAVGLWLFARVYTESRSVEDARAALVQLGAMQQSYWRLHGEYTDDVSALAAMTDDWHAFMNSLDVVLDLKAGFSMETTRTGYRITAHARDRAATAVVYEGPPRKLITEAAKRR